MKCTTHTYETLPDGSRTCFECGYKPAPGGKRDGAGRPPSMTNAKPFMVRMGDEHAAHVKSLADTWGCSMAEAVRRAVVKAAQGGEA